MKFSKVKNLVERLVKSEITHKARAGNLSTNIIRLYRGQEKKFNPNYDNSRTDAPSGYSTWTDNKLLAKQYAGPDSLSII